MPKVEIEKTVEVGGKVFFPGEAHVSDAEAKAIKEAAREVKADPQATKKEKK